MGEPRSSRLEFGAVKASDFLAFAHRNTLDTADGSRIKSQYAEALTRDDKDVGVIGLFGCGELIAALSWGTVALPRPGALSARLDVVVTAPHCRKLGIGRLMVAEFVCQMLQTFGNQIEHFSVIAVHPAIAHIVESLGFVNANVGSSSPIFHRMIDTSTRADVAERAGLEVTNSMNSLRLGCARCLWRKSAPWCREGVV